MGVPASTNEPPGLYSAAFWTDTAGNLWLYGGASTTNSQKSLWKFDPSTMDWTWMKGSDSGSSSPIYAVPAGFFDAQNEPGSLKWGMNTWTDKQNHLWLYGGCHILVSNILWQYNPAINQWAWQGGHGMFPVYGTKGIEDSANTPGARYEGNAAWIDDANNLWLFGGWDQINRAYNDLWKYNITSGMWAWMSGGNVSNDSVGSYGPVGASSVNYFPSSRASNFHWQDSSKNFWLVGGENYYLSYYYNDVWKFNLTSLEWTLVKGSMQSNADNVSSGNCAANMNNQENGRYENRATWKLCDNLVLNYGGVQRNHPNNDLWAFLPQQNEWVEINEGPPIGNYGIKGISSPSNYPPARNGSCSFVDKDNNIWLFGGMDSLGREYNDLWKYVLDTACLGNSYCPKACNLSSPTITATTTIICPTDSAQICAPPNYTSYTWNNNNGTGKCIQAKSARNYYVTVTDNSGCTAESNHISITAFQSPAVSISQSGDTLRVYNQTNVQWYLNDNPIPNATQNIYVAQAFGNYKVSVTDSNGCTSFSLPTRITGIEDISNYQNISIYPNPLSAGNFQLAVSNNLIGAQVEILDNNGKLVYKTEIKNEHTEIAAQLSGGVYLLRITTGACVVVRKLVKL